MKLFMRSALILLTLLIFLTGCAPLLEKKTETIFSCNPFPNGLPTLSEQQKQELINSVYGALSDSAYRKKRDSFSQELEGLNHEVVITLWQDGKAASFGRASSSNLAKTTYLSTLDALSKLPLPNLAKPFSPMITILSNDKVPYPQTNLSWGLQALEGNFNSRSALVLGTEFIAKNYNRDQAASLICSKLRGLKNCISDNKTLFFSRDELLIGVTSNFTPLTFYRGNPLICAAQNPTNLARTMHSLGKQWLILNVREDGLWPYLIYPSIMEIEDSDGDGRNKDLREAMPARLLARYAREDPSLLSLHKKNIDGLLREFYREKSGKGYMWHETESKLNTNAFMLRAIVASPLFEEYQEVAEKLGETILEQQYPNGSFRNWYPAPNEPYNETHLTFNQLYPESYFVSFSSGEAILALTELYLKTNESRYLDAAIASQHYYLTEYVEHMDKNYYPAYVPWHTLSLYNLYLITGNQTYAEAVFTLNNKLLEIQNVDGEPSLDFKGRFYSPASAQYGAPHSSSDGVFTEGVVYAYALSSILNRSELSSFYNGRIQLSIGNLARLQFNDANMFYISNPSLVKGGMRTSISNNIIRVDNTQHMLDGIGAYLEFESASDHSTLKDTLGNSHLIHPLPPLTSP